MEPGLNHERATAQFDATCAASQHTIRRPIERADIGVHSGRRVSLRIEPAAENTGITFIRSDLPGAPELTAAPDCMKILASRRMSVLERHDEQRGEIRVGMVEHLLSACAGLGVTNLRAVMDSEECPIFDGSALSYVEMIREAGMVAQTAPARRFRLKRPVGLLRDNAELIALPAERTRYTFFAEFQAAGLPDEQVTFEPSRENYESEIAAARTFCFWKDIEPLRAAGLIKGGSLDNAIVLKDGKPVELRGEIETEGKFRMKDELARHKLLDLMGDMAVLGAPVLALISARASGHALHQEFIRILQNELEDA
jgi:UDP-3-O-[3-hydroxymyristoyl] N-acetylglucosamine deacetylase